MKKFNDRTKTGIERALKRGTKVPDGAVNLAWVQSPKLTPENNIVVVDTSRVVEENFVKVPAVNKVYYANALGILEDKDGNQIIEDEFPYVTDVFSVDEDFLTTPGSEYTDDSVLPFVHISRYFHLDSVGMSLGSNLQSIRSEKIKVVDNNGREYLNDSGLPKYKIKLVSAISNLATDETSVPYRIWAFVDSNDNESLYLTYDMVAINSDGTLTELDVDYKELLNPSPYFSYKPEESDVLDDKNKDQKIYSTKPVTLKQQLLDVPHTDPDGYKVYVPKKAVGDSRIFQTFRWRVLCDFIIDSESVHLDKSIRAGFVTTSWYYSNYWYSWYPYYSSGSAAPFAFGNLERSIYNKGGVNFINPIPRNAAQSGSNPYNWWGYLLDTSGNTPNEETAGYWAVNFENVTYEELSLFDMLVWSPESYWFDFTPYLAKIDYFVNTLGRTLIIDSANFTVLNGLGITTTSGVIPNTGSIRTWGGVAGTPLRADTLRLTNPNHIIFNSEDLIRGWDLDSTDISTLAPYSKGTNAPGYTQKIVSYPSDYEVVIDAKETTGAVPYQPLVIRKPYASGGNLFISTMGIVKNVNDLYSDTTGALVSNNNYNFPYQDPNYRKYISAPAVAGAAKLLYNIALLSVKSKNMFTAGVEQYSTSWQASTSWKPSWVIKADVLSDSEKANNNFSLLPKSNLDNTPVWQRRLTSKSANQLINETMSSDDLRRFSSAKRAYTLEVTNNLVSPGNLVNGDSVPYAWTEAYTPQFEVPVELGPHIIKEETTTGEFEASQLMYKQYPPKPYALQVGINNLSDPSFLKDYTVNWTATGTANQLFYITDSTPTSTSTAYSDIKLSWATHGNRTYTASSRVWDYGVLHPDGIRTWQEDNYYVSRWGSSNLLWPNFGVTSRIGLGSRGEIVSFLQEAMNKFVYFGLFNSTQGYIPVDGYFGPVTKTVVTAFQTAFGARFINGFVDAETWALIGFQIIRLGAFVRDINAKDHFKYFNLPGERMMKQYISDLDNTTFYDKRSWIEDGPSIVWEIFQIDFKDEYDIHGITIVPHVVGATNTISVACIDVRTRPFTLTNYDPSTAKLKDLPFKPRDGESLYIPFGPYKGNSLIVGVAQTGSSGIGSSRMLGIRDIAAHAKVPTTATTSLGSSNFTQQQKPIIVTSDGTARVSFKFDTWIYPQPNETSDTDWLSDIKWTSVDPHDANITATIYDWGVMLRPALVNTNINTKFTFGTQLPGTSFKYYAMSEDGKISPIRETGWISKVDGIKLLCDQSGNPVGFPTIPTTVGAYSYNKDFVNIAITNMKSDPSVIVGFYDRNKREFIVSNSGNPEMLYKDYLDRGPQNVYIAVKSTYEAAIDNPVTNTDDTSHIPYRWALPVYGVSTRPNSPISIAPISKNLTATEIWPVPIKTGHFTRSIEITDANTLPMTTGLRDYVGQIVKAFYSLPEAKNSLWSNIYGRPNVDIKNEHPDVLAINTIQLRQTPILIAQEPTLNRSLADPARPVFKVYTRPDMDTEWQELSWSDISDYNTSLGIIYLKTPLSEKNPDLVKVDYTTSGSIYDMKQADGQRINLNPYLAGTDLVGKAIYIYLLPEYVKDNLGNIIQSTVNDTALHFTTDPSIFNPMRPDYNSLAVQLAIVYIATALSLDDLVLLDTRRKGGGAKDSLMPEQVKDLLSESASYWDISYGYGISYQKGGFIIIRLPESLKERFTKEEITEVIERNITAGVMYKIQTLEGQDWDVETV